MVDLMGGWADRRETRPFAAATPDAGVLDHQGDGQPDGRPAGRRRRALLRQARRRGLAGVRRGGKAALTVEQVLSHQGGLAGLAGPMTPADWFDWDGVCATAGGDGAAVAARQRQRLPPGDLRLSGRRDLPAHRRPHPGRGAARGHRRTAGARSLDRPARHRARPLRRRAPAAGACPTWARSPRPSAWPSSPPGPRPAASTQAAWRRAEIPSVTGHATAPALARLMAVRGLRRRLDAAGARRPARRRGRGASGSPGADLVLPYDMALGRRLPPQRGALDLRPGPRDLRPLRLGRQLRLRRSRSAASRAPM